jgi:hypothetical protein
MLTGELKMTVLSTLLHTCDVSREAHTFLQSQAARSDRAVTPGSIDRAVGTDFVVCPSQISWSEAAVISVVIPATVMLKENRPRSVSPN